MPQWILTGMMLHVPAGMGLLPFVYILLFTPEQHSASGQFSLDSLSGLLNLSLVDNGDEEDVLVNGVANDFLFTG